jgi:hypothetical protein
MVVAWYPLLERQTKISVSARDSDMQEKQMAKWFIVERSQRSVLTVGCLIDSGMNSRAEKRRIILFFENGKRNIFIWSSELPCSIHFLDKIIQSWVNHSVHLNPSKIMDSVVRVQVSLKITKGRGLLEKGWTHPVDLKYRSSVHIPIPQWE